MASSQIDIKIRTLIEGVQGIQNLVTQLNSLSTGASGVGPATQGATSAVSGLGSSATGSSTQVGALGGTLSQITQHTNAAKAGLSSLQSDLSSAGAGFDSLAGYVKSAGAAFIAFLAVKGVKDLADYAARTETLGVTLDVVAKNAGYTTTEINTFESGLKKLGITTQAARESMTSMIQAGIPLGVQTGQTSSNVERLARAAQDLAVVTGENSSDTLKRLTTNIQQMDTMGLRFMGLTVDIQKAQDVFADAIGKPTAALTQQQKVMAVNNAVLIESAKLQGAYEASMETVGKKVASLKRYQEELSEAMGTKLLPAYNAIADAATNLLSSLEKQVKASDSSGEASKAFGESVKYLVQQISELVLAMGKFAADDMGSSLSSLASNLVGVVGDIFKFITALTTAGTEAGAFSSVLKFVAGVIAFARDMLKSLEMSLLGAAAIAEKVVGMIARGWGGLLSLFGMTTIGKALEDFGTQMEGMAAKTLAASTRMTKDMKANRSAFHEFQTGVKNADLSLASFGKANNLKELSADITRLAEAKALYGSKDESVIKSGQAVADNMVALAKKGLLVGAAYDEMAIKAVQAGAKLPSGFATAEEAAASLKAAIKAAHDEVANFSNVSNIDEAAVAIQKLTKYQGDNTISAMDQKAAYDLLSKKLAQYKEEGADTKKLEDAQRRLDGINSKFASSFADALKNMGVSADELRTGVSKKFSETTGAISAFVAEVETTASQFQVKFSMEVDTAKSTAEVSALTAILQTARDKAEALAKAGRNDEAADWLAKISESAKLLAIQFDKTFEKSLSTAKTREEFIRLQQDVVKTGALTGQTTEWMETRLAAVGAAASRAGSDVANSGISSALKKIGISAEEMNGQASRNIQDVIVELKTLHNAAEVSADGYYKAFSKAVGMAKSISDIQAFRTELKASLDEGKIGWSEYSSGLQLVDSRFNELFQTQLKAAKTKEDFAQLRAEVQKLGVDGSISATQMGTALNQISEAANGTRAEMIRLGQVAKDLASASLGVTQAEAGVVSGNIELQKTKNQLVKAELADKSQGTDQSRAEVEAVRASVTAAEAKLKVQQAILAAKQAEMELAKAMADLSAAEAAYAVDKSAANQAAVEAAKGAVDAAKAQASYAQAAVSEAQALATSTQSAADAAKAYADNIGAAAENAKDTRDWVRDSEGKVLSASVVNWQYAVEQFKAAGLSMQEAEAAADSYMSRSAQWALIGFENIQRWQSVADAIQEAKKNTDEAAAAAEAENEQAAQIKENFANIVTASEMAAKGISGWSAGAGAVAQAYAEIKKSAISAAQSAEDAARSFVSSASGIQEELLNALGQEDEAIKLRFESRKRDLALQYEQLKIQIQIAKVQAQAAGVDSSGLDKAAADAAASYTQALGQLAQLEAIATQKAKEQAEARKKAEADAKAKKATDDAASKNTNQANQQKETPAEQARAGAASVGQTNTGVTRAPTPPTPAPQAPQPKPQAPQPIIGSIGNLGVGALTDAIKVSGMATTGAITNSIANLSKGLTSRVTSALPRALSSLGLDAATPASANGEETFASTSSNQPGALNPVDVSKIIINFGTKDIPIYTDPGNKKDLLSELTSFRKRALGS